MLSYMVQRRLNVELSNFIIGGIKYLFKCICKGIDKVTAQLVGGQRRYDEISKTKNAIF